MLCPYRLRKQPWASPSDPSLEAVELFFPKRIRPFAVALALGQQRKLSPGSARHYSGQARGECAFIQRPGARRLAPPAEQSGKSVHIARITFWVLGRPGGGEQ